MKEIFLEKGVSENGGKPSEDDMALINAQSRRALTSDEVYTFNLVLCDNEIDRDMEQFSPSALEGFSKLFVGKTGIFDHSLKSRDQTARIFKTQVETVEGRTNSLGQPYVKLTAKAYMPKTSKNADIIAEIDAGILKEISVGCSVSSVTCSVCGSDVNESSCAHIKGRLYSGKPCYHILSQPTDAYEWSFVAVPAQKNAGVQKSFKGVNQGGDEKMTDIFEVIKSADDSVTLSKAQAAEIAEKIEKNERMAKFGELYCASLTEKVMSLCPVVLPDMDAEIFAGIAKKLGANELAALQSAFSKKAAEIIPPTVQLLPKTKSVKPQNHSEFKI